jgi:hypothetical protein
MVTNCLNSIWALSENYLDISNAHYSVVSRGNETVLYKTEGTTSSFSKILHWASFALIVLILFSFVFSKLCKKTIPYKECHATSKPIIQEFNCEAIATEDCYDTHEWRKKLIQSAQHNIVISGNYCGGESFDELLDCIKLRLVEVPQLKVVVISHPKFLTEKTEKN